MLFPSTWADSWWQDWAASPLHWDVRCREMEQAWAASREQSGAVRDDSLLQGVRCHWELDLLNTKHLSEIQRKTSRTSQGGSAFLLREAQVFKQTHLPPGMTQTLYAGISGGTVAPCSLLLAGEINLTPLCGLFAHSRCESSNSHSSQAKLEKGKKMLKAPWHGCRQLC